MGKHGGGCVAGLMRPITRFDTVHINSIEMTANHELRQSRQAQGWQVIAQH